MADVLTLAKQFVAIVHKYLTYEEAEKMSAEEVDTLFAVVEEAGFEAKALECAKVMYSQNSDGGHTNVFLLNNYCPLKVVDDDGENDEVATSWLNHAWSYVAAYRELSEIHELEYRMEKEIKRSVPMRPIWLSNKGDRLLECPPPGRGFFVDHTRDEKDLSEGCVGIHECCNGFVDRKRATHNNDVLVCRQCFLRVYIPRKVKTYGDLRVALV
jgi:hypothetical protein